jgi:hypothetical protein
MGARGGHAWARLCARAGSRGARRPWRRGRLALCARVRAGRREGIRGEKAGRGEERRDVRERENRGERESWETAAGNSSLGARVPKLGFGVFWELGL